MDDRDRGAPEALPAEQPVAQAEVHEFLARALLLQDLDGGRDGLCLGQAVQGAGVDQGALARGRGAADRGIFLAGVQHGPDRQVEGAGEVEVALVVCRDGHDGAGAVVGQDVVGGPDGQLLAVERVDGVAAGEDAGLLPLGGLAFDFGERLDLFAVRVQGGGVFFGDQFDGERRVRGDDEERRAVQGVRAGGEHRDVLGGLAAVGLDHEVDVRAFGASDPVLLHRQDAFGPVAAQFVHVIEQPVGVVGDLEVPLVQRLLGDGGAAALTGTVDHLFVGQHGLVLRAPVDRGILAVGQSALVEALEEPLRPAVILRDRRCGSGGTSRQRWRSA